MATMAPIGLLAESLSEPDPGSMAGMVSMATSTTAGIHTMAITVRCLNAGNDRLSTSTRMKHGMAMGTSATRTTTSTASTVQASRDMAANMADTARGDKPEVEAVPLAGLRSSHLVLALL